MKALAVVMTLGLLASLAAWGRVGLMDAQPAYNSDNLIRFHVLANSDTPEDQQIKRRVRDAILTSMGEEFLSAMKLDDARAAVFDALPLMEEIGAAEVAAAGKNYPVKAEFGIFPFPTRSYGELTLPSGNYQAVRVIIGEGSGENWWCVLFPPLCFVDIAAYAGNPPGTEVSTPVMAQGKPQRGQVQRDVELRFKVLEVWRRNRRHIAEGSTN
ncbi:hypothetical protein SY88_03610 [Clostridiales bacterium PH28_bin88]|nr:hypothetical protein SY88_03610 [Clostridiales bacterium PH28_bin88]